MPLLIVLLSDGEILCVVGHTRLNHRPLEPLIKRTDRDPVRATRNRCIPAGTIGSAVIARHDEGVLASWNKRVIIARHDASRPDLLCVMSSVIGIDLVAETLIHSL